jgi:predicted nuclease of predicted toxin-antitoxin system
VRLLFDENLSHRLVRELADVYPDSAHVRDVGLRGAEELRASANRRVAYVSRHDGKAVESL